MKRIISILSIFTILFFSTNSALAVSNPDAVEKEMLEEMNNFEEITNKFVINDLKNNFKKFSHTLTVSNDLLNYHEAKAYNVKNSNIKVLSVPVNDGENYHEISNVSIYFDKNGEMINRSEAYLSKSDKNTFHVKVIVNDEVLTDEVTNDPFITAEEYQQKDDRLVQTYGVNWDTFLNCMGIPGVTASLISSACGVACAVTAGAGCIACASFVLGFNAGSISGCLTNSWE